MTSARCRCGAPLGLRPGRAGAVSIGLVGGEEVCARCGALDGDRNVNFVDESPRQRARRASDAIKKVPT